MQLKDIAEIQFSIPIATKKKEDICGKWLNGSGLLENNQINTVETLYKYDLKSVIQVLQEDLLLKRISPTFVNIYEDIQSAYIGTNIIRIRVKEEYDPYFVMFVLENHLKELNEKSNNGTRISAINREALEGVEIPNVEIKQQKRIGNLIKLKYKSMALQQELHNKIALKNKLIEKQILLKLKGEN